MKRILHVAIVLLTIVLYSCSEDINGEQQPTIEQQVEQQLSSLTLKQKVCQMFFVRPEAMYLSVEEVDRGKMT